MRLRLSKTLAVLACATFAACGGKGAAPAVDKGIQLFEAGDYDGAIVYYEAKLAETPENAEATYYLGRIAMAQQQPDDALGHLKHAVELAPDSADYHYWLAIAYANKVNATQNMMEKGQLAPMMKTSAEKAIELDPGHLGAREFLAQYMFNAPPIVGGDPAKGWEQVEAIKERDPKRGHLFSARLHTAKKEFDEARAEIEAAAGIDPDDVDVYFQLGRLNQDAEDYDAAFAAFERALELEPGHMPSLYQMGRTGAFSGENAGRAIECLMMYMKTNPAPNEPTWSHAQWRLGMIYEKQGKPDMARAAYEKAIEMDPENEFAQKALDALDGGE